VAVRHWVPAGTWWWLIEALMGDSSQAELALPIWGIPFSSPKSSPDCFFRSQAAS
jgi:hypothetical protein